MFTFSGFGDVYKGTEMSKSKQRVAIKKLPHKGAKSKKSNWSEVYFLSKCDHPNIVRFDQVMPDETTVNFAGNECRTNFEPNQR